jgi:outer membrane protein assembly factor BamB
VTLVRLAAILGILGALAGCSRDVILEGERVDIRAPWGGGARRQPRAPMALPDPAVNASWTHRQGDPGTRPRHPGLSAPSRSWPGRPRSGRAMRAASGCRPTRSLPAGASSPSTPGRACRRPRHQWQVIWARDLTPPGQRPTGASGGGLAVAGDRLYVASAYGFIAALDAATGAEIWRHRFDAPLTGAPRSPATASWSAPATARSGPRRRHRAHRLDDAGHARPR